MPDLTDVLRSTLVYRIAGVTCRNDRYDIVTNVGSVANLTEVAVFTQNEFQIASQDVVSLVLEYIACFVDNLTSNEVRGIAVSAALGLDIDGSHPQDQVLLFNEYGNNVSTLPLRRGGFNLSGVAEHYSTEGRLNSTSEFTPMINFLQNPLVDSPSGFSMSPQVRTRVIGPDPPEYEYHNIHRVRINPTFRKLKSRKTNILGI